MNSEALKRARPWRLAILGAAMAMVVAACNPPAEPDPDPGPGPNDGRISFDSPMVLEMAIDRGTPEEPNMASLPFTGQAKGAWLVADGGLLFANFQIDDGELVVPAERSPIGVEVVVGLSAQQKRTAVGFFDPATGQGSLSTGVDVTLTTLNGGPLPQPCIASTSFDLSGGIDPATGVLEVSETDFEFTPMASTDCGGLGGIIAPMLQGSNLGTLSFEVGTA